MCNICGEYTGGEEFYYTYEDGVLTVFGKGELTEATWRAARKKNYFGVDAAILDECNTLVIAGNITGIGRDVFDWELEGGWHHTVSDSLTRLVIEDSVTGEIGWQAFGHRYKLTDVYIGDGIHTISHSAFDSDLYITSFSVSRNCSLEVIYQKYRDGSLTGVMYNIFGSGSISVIANEHAEKVTYR